MYGRANLLIFVFVSLALVPRERLPQVQAGSASQCTLCNEPNAEGVGRWSTRGWADRQVRPGEAEGCLVRI